MLRRNHHSRAFSILEIMVSITIIALLVASVVTGKNVKRRLDLNRVIEDISITAAALGEFKVRFDGYPGDLYNAATVLKGEESTSGNGNGVIEGDERYAFWDHLFHAALITERPPGNKDREASVKNGVYIAGSDGQGIITIQVSTLGSEGVFTTRDAYDLDVITDDGVASTGKTRGLNGTNQNCLDSNTNDYDLTNKDGKPCVLVFYIN